MLNLIKTCWLGSSKKAGRPKKKKIESKVFVSYDLPPQIEKIWKRKQEEIEKMRGRRKNRFKTREDFETDEEFDKYLKESKKKKTPKKKTDKTKEEK